VNTMGLGLASPDDHITALRRSMTILAQ